MCWTNELEESIRFVTKNLWSFIQNIFKSLKNPFSIEPSPSDKIPLPCSYEEGKEFLPSLPQILIRTIFYPCLRISFGILFIFAIFSSAQIYFFNTLILFPNPFPLGGHNDFNQTWRPHKSWMQYQTHGEYEATTLNI